MTKQNESKKERSLWPTKEELTCVILCGGRGSRILPLSMVKQKGMIQVHNKPVLEYIIDYWRQYTDNFVFVVKYKKEDIIEYVSKLPINSRFAEPDELRGIANGIYYAKDLVTSSFIVTLGDCICKGNFVFPEKMEQGVGICKTTDINDIKRSYSVVVQNGSVLKVTEKPQEIINDLCGMGFYFFNQSVFDYIPETPPSTLRHEVEITDVIQNMIEAGEKIAPVIFEGNYVNITYPQDLQMAERFLK